MNNGIFIDIMDKINNVAKSKGYQNGIAWANKAVEAKTINQYDLAAFEGCHHLRNLMAHGFSRDIVISNETMNIVKTFYRCITMPAPQPQPVVQSKVLSATAEKPDPDAFAKKGDYVVVLDKNNYKYPLQIYKYDTVYNSFMRKYEENFVSMYSINTYIDPSTVDGNIYILRPKTPIDPKKYNKANAFCENESKEIRYDSNGRQFVTVRIKYVNFRSYEDGIWDTVDCEVYHARPECFIEKDPFPLHVGSESITKYMENENLWGCPTNFQPKKEKKSFLYHSWSGSRLENLADGDLAF